LKERYFQYNLQFYVHKLENPDPSEQTSFKVSSRRRSKGPTDKQLKAIVKAILTESNSKLTAGGNQFWKYLEDQKVLNQETFLLLSLYVL